MKTQAPDRNSAWPQVNATVAPQDALLARLLGPMLRSAVSP